MQEHARVGDISSADRHIHSGLSDLDHLGRLGRRRVSEHRRPPRRRRQRGDRLGSVCAAVDFLLLHGRFGFRRRDARLFFRHGLSRRARRRGSRLFPRNRLWRGGRDQARNFLARVRVDFLAFAIAGRFGPWRRAARIIAGSVAGDGLLRRRRFQLALLVGDIRRRSRRAWPLFGGRRRRVFAHDLGSVERRRFDNDVDRRFLDDGNLDPDFDLDEHQQKKRGVDRQRRRVSDDEIREPGSQGFAAL